MENQFTSIILDPTIIDIGKIPLLFVELKSLTMAIASGMVFFLFVLNMISEYLKAFDGSARYHDPFIRTGIALLCLVMYDSIFSGIVNVAVLLEYSILSEKEWGDLLLQLGNLYLKEGVSILDFGQYLMAWVSSGFAVVIKVVLYWIRFVLLALMYAVGPIIFACYIFKPFSYITKSWFKNVIQIALWTVTLKIIVRVLIQINIMKYATNANTASDYLSLLVINVLFTVLMVFCPIITAKFLSGEAIGSVAVLAAGAVTSHLAPVLRTTGGQLRGFASGVMRPITGGRLHSGSNMHSSGSGNNGNPGMENNVISQDKSNVYRGR